VRKFIFVGAFLTGLLVIVSFSGIASAKEWYEGGTLHGATAAQWQEASHENKLATCADWLAFLYSNNKLALSVTNMDELKPYAQELTVCLDTSLEGLTSEEVGNNGAVELSLMCVALMGWLK
jgi:hypothetical protein